MNTAKRLRLALDSPTVAPDLNRRGVAERKRRANHENKRALRNALRTIDDLREQITSYQRFTSEPLHAVAPRPLRDVALRPAAAVALLSDLHAEERIDRSDAIDNEYSLAIAEHRLTRFFRGLIWLIEHNARAFKIDTLVLWLGGDLISGDIHDELLERCEVPPGEATMLVRSWILSGLRSILRAFPSMCIRVPCSLGNHGRTTKRVRAATGYGHSWEWMLYQILGGDFADEPRVQIHSTQDEMQYLSVLGHELAFHHGHRIKYRGGIGGVTVPAIKAAHRWDQWRQCDYYHFGHYHQRIDLGQIAFNGSVIGPSPYSFAIGAKPEAPQQSFYVLDQKRGKTMSCPIWVAS